MTKQPIASPEPTEGGEVSEQLKQRLFEIYQDQAMEYTGEVPGASELNALMRRHVDEQIEVFREHFDSKRKEIEALIETGSSVKGDTDTLREILFGDES